MQGKAFSGRTFGKRGDAGPCSMFGQYWGFRVHRIALRRCLVGLPGLRWSPPMPVVQALHRGAGLKGSNGLLEDSFNQIVVALCVPFQNVCYLQYYNRGALSLYQS